MNFLEAVKVTVAPKCAMIHRTSAPDITYCFDGAEDIEFWSMNRRTDDLEEHHFTMEDYMAEDWEIVEGTQAPNT